MAVTVQEDDEIDHYEVLCLLSGKEGAQLTIEQIEKAYRTQPLLCHPDKCPDDPNATADFQRLANSYNLLCDESLRRQFDARLSARHEAAARVATAGAKRRKAVTDLEELKRAATAAPVVDPAKATRCEDKQKAADVKRELDEFFAAKKAAASTSAHRDKKGEPSKDGVKTDKGKILKVSWEGGAEYYTAAKLEEIFKQFGIVEDIVIKTRKSMASKEAAVSHVSVMGSLISKLMSFIS